MGVEATGGPNYYMQNRLGVEALRGGSEVGVGLEMGVG